MRKAWLVIRDGHRWEFKTTDSTSDLLFHWTRYEHLYAILPGIYAGKPFWVGRLCAKAWLSWEGTLGARRIEFDGGGVYTFPGRG